MAKPFSLTSSWADEVERAEEEAAIAASKTNTPTQLLSCQIEREQPKRGMRRMPAAAAHPVVVAPAVQAVRDSENNNPFTFEGGLGVRCHLLEENGRSQNEDRELGDRSSKDRVYRSSKGRDTSSPKEHRSGKKRWTASPGRGERKLCRTSSHLLPPHSPIPERSCLAASLTAGLQHQWSSPCNERNGGLQRLDDGGKDNQTGAIVGYCAASTTTTKAAQERHKIDPFSGAKPREVLLAERGINWRRLDFELEQRSTNAKVTAEDTSGRDEIKSHREHEGKERRMRYGGQVSLATKENVQQTNLSMCQKQTARLNAFCHRAKDTPERMILHRHCRAKEIERVHNSQTDRGIKPHSMDTIHPKFHGSKGNESQCPLDRDKGIIGPAFSKSPTRRGLLNVSAAERRHTIVGVQSYRQPFHEIPVYTVQPYLPLPQGNICLIRDPITGIFFPEVVGKHVSMKQSGRSTQRPVRGGYGGRPL